MYYRAYDDASLMKDCEECGAPIVEDASPEVWLHYSDSTPDGIDHDMDADHVARPPEEMELEDEAELI